MELTQSLIMLVASVAATMGCAAACKINVESEPRLDENGKPIPTSDHPVIRIFQEFNSLGVGILVSIIASYGLSWNDLTAERPSTFEFLISAVVFGVIEFIGFVIIFYIVYAIMSAAKVSGTDEKVRRNSAGWVTVVLSFILIFIAAGQ